jgi:hypothetical protein
MKINNIKDPGSISQPGQPKALNAPGGLKRKNPKVKPMAIGRTCQSTFFISTTSKKPPLCPLAY